MAPVYMFSYFTFTHSAHERTARSQCSNTLIVPLWNITAGPGCWLTYDAVHNNQLLASTPSENCNSALLLALVCFER